MGGGIAIHLLLCCEILVVVGLVLLGGGGCREEERFVTVSVDDLQWIRDGEISSYGYLQVSPAARASGSSNKAAAVLELKHHLSSPPTTATQDLHHNFHHQLLLADEARATSIQSRLCHRPVSPPNKHLHQSQAELPLTSGAAVRTLNYIINISLGGRDALPVIVDTGSVLTWVQCKPCTSCYSQQNPLYDPSSSPTYHPLPCNSTPCTSLSTSPNPPACKPDQPSCSYSLRYGDGSYSRGVLAQEKLLLGEASVDNFIFGCGRSNRGLFGSTSGLVGLGRTQLSLVTQSRPQFGGVFSYCLPSRVYNSSGTLILGDAPSSYKNTTPIAYTSLVQGPRETPFYFLNLTGVRVGGVELGVSKGARVLIDSGTVITRLVPSLYNAVRDEFVKQFTDYPTALGFSILDTCFDLSKSEHVRVPELGLGFEGGVEMKVDVSGMLYFAKKDASQVCLAMTSLADEDGVGIVGNYQQKNQRVVYDNVGERVGFGVENCSYGT